MISLAECAPCKAMRLQQEAEEEFRQRFGVVNAVPASMGWRPYLGQATPISQPAAAPPPAEKTYLDDVREKLLWFSVGGAVGFPVGLLSNVAFKSVRKLRKEAAVFAAITASIGLLAAFAPVKSPIISGIAKFSGVLTGGAMADVALPRKVLAPLPG